MSLETNLLSEMKQCSKCQKHLSISLFWKDSSKKSGYVSKCSICYKEQRQSTKYKAYRKEYEQTEQYKEYQKNYELNKRVRTEKDKETRRTREKQYRSQNLLFKLKQNCNRRIREALFSKSYSKKSKYTKYLGCEIDFLKKHLESQFQTNMSWENYGEWEIDHRIPLAIATNEQELIPLLHYTNLQPMWKQENRKKSDKYVSTSTN